MEACDYTAQCEFATSFINFSVKLDEARICALETASGCMPKRRHAKHTKHNSKRRKIKYFTEITLLVFMRQSMND